MVSPVPVRMYVVQVEIEMVSEYCVPGGSTGSVLQGAYLKFNYREQLFLSDLGCEVSYSY